MHLIAYTNLKDRQYEEAFKYQITVANFFQSAFQNDTNWALPALNAIVLDLRILANLVSPLALPKIQYTITMYRKYYARYLHMLI